MWLTVFLKGRELWEGAADTSKFEEEDEDEEAADVDFSQYRKEDRDRDADQYDDDEGAVVLSDSD